MKVVLFGLENVIDILLRVSIDERKPCTLHMDHDAVPGLKRMKQIAQFKSYSGRLAWDQRLWLGETFPKATSDHPCSDQLLASGS